MKCRYNVHAGGGIINNIIINKDRVYRIVDNEYSMIYKYQGETMSELIDLLLEGEYDDNFITSIDFD